MANLAERYNIDLSREHKTGCPGCIREGNDKSRNNLHVYASKASAHCFACGWTIASAEHKAKMGWEDTDEEEEVETRERITPEAYKKLKGYTSTDGKNYRGINNATNIFCGIRYSYDETTGEPDRMHVPTTIEGKMVGQKVRVFPKDFSHPIGIVGKECDMVGQHLYKNGGRVCLIVGGEVDFASATQMLWDYQVSKGHQEFARVAVVSPTVGETGCAKQVQAQYEFFAKFDKIVIGFDNDDAGRKATHDVAKVLPKGKVYVATWSGKDPNEMLVAGKAKTFVDNYFRSLENPYVPVGIVGSGSLGQSVRDEANADRIEFPPKIMGQINKMTGGGAGLGKIVNIGAGSGIGKTIFVEAIVEHLIFNSAYPVGVVSMELSAGQYGLSMLSRRVGVKINKLPSKEERMAFLELESTKAAEQELYFKPDGSHRWHLVDDRDGSLKALQDVVEQLVVSCGCKLIVLDPIQDILDGLSNEEQALFLRWQKGMIKSHTITFININHVRKSQGGGKQNSGGAMISEEDFAGSSTIFKSGALNILLVRDKMHEDPIERNTTLVFISKNRDTGETGPAGKIYYCNETHQLYDFDAWTEAQGAVFSN